MNIGIIGTGSIAHAFLDALQHIPSASCTAILSRRQSTAEPLAQQYGIARIHTVLDELLHDPEVDWIYIASPNSLHFDYALQALQHGKHVICEKPFTSTTRELQILIRTARKQQLFLFEAITNIHLPNYQWIKQNIDRLGPIRLIQCNYSQYSRKYNELLSGGLPNVFNPAFSGGALMDINIYNLHLVMNLFGSPRQVSYTANKHSGGIDTSGVLVLTYDEYIAECVGAKDTHGMNFVLIQGENGYFHIEHGANGCRRILIHTGEQQMEYNEQTIDNPLYYELAVFEEIYRSSDYSRCYELLDHSYAVMQTLEAARRDAGIVFAADTMDHPLSSF
ncbi:Gfo/Idh/MocA family protein [Paenibacillus bovis]|uniref:Oxidoreductase n=1 Tax=Paenibacillus bovis TaxID=1616788 RepID=A0A172ZD80_9BACL|nr:Gfo/Idh/MocA family oxidoreductase [Paenibacillus bovis]ANF95568.1 oxidoreductase [Paenibacillus bovis]